MKVDRGRTDDRIGAAMEHSKRKVRGNVGSRSTATRNIAKLSTTAGPLIE
jgi:hypothetical protein